jgi:hypothetical protein
VFEVFRRRKQFRVLLEGHNVLLRDVESGRTTKLGFFATRFIRSNDEVDARAMARSLVAKEMLGIGLLNDPSDGPRFEVAEVEEVRRAESAKGFTFFPETEV